MRKLVTFLFVLFISFLATAQDEIIYTSLQREGDSTYPVYSLNDCIVFAMKNQPAIRQAGLDEAIAHTNKAIAFSSWLPQVSLGANLQHYLELPTSFLRVNDVLTPIRTGVNNTSNPQITATQNIFSSDALFANRTAHLYIRLQDENTITTKMDAVAAIERAYYDVLLSGEKVKVYRQDTQRLQKNQADAYHRFVSGVADKVDYKQATIALNNSLSQLRGATESVQSSYAVLRRYMGMPATQPFRVQYDTSNIMQQASADTTVTLRLERRPEYRALLIARQIQKIATGYYQTGFIPSLYGYYTYNYQFQNNNFGDLYNKAYPNSFLGLQLNVPLFTGFRRLQNIHKSKLQEERADWDIVNLKLVIYTEYRQALVAYQSNRYSYRTQAENLGMAREVYNIVKLQYTEGIKAYLDVIVAETDLQTSEINYQNALFELLKSKTNLDRAVGFTPIQ